MKRALLVVLTVMIAVSFVSAQTIETSRQKTLFIFPIQYGSNAQGLTQEQHTFIKQEFYKTFVSTFERFEFIEVRADKTVDQFLGRANDFVMENAQELLQRRMEPDGRIGEARVTISDLTTAVEESYAFVPSFKKVQQKTDDDGDVYFEIEAEIEIYQTATGERVAVVSGTTSGIGGALGAMGSLLHGGDQTVEQKFESSVRGVFNEMKTRMRQLDIFALRAAVIETHRNYFTFDLGTNFGVRLDRRYRVVAYNAEGEISRMIAFGKVRSFETDRSNVQILLGGDIAEGDQVIEYAAFGLNINPMFGTLPVKTEGFDNYSYYDLDLPEDDDAMQPWIGFVLEYNVAAITNVSEFYTVLEGGYVMFENTVMYNAMVGFEKKFYFANIALFGAAKVGILRMDVDLDEGSNFDDDAKDVVDMYGLSIDVGGEMLLTPNVGLQLRASYYMFPEQSFDDWGVFYDDPTVEAIGLSIRAGLLITL